MLIKIKEGRRRDSSWEVVNDCFCIPCVVSLTTLLFHLSDFFYQTSFIKSKSTSLLAFYFSSPFPLPSFQWRKQARTAGQVHEQADTEVNPPHCASLLTYWCTWGTLIVVLINFYLQLQSHKISRNEEERWLGITLGIGCSGSLSQWIIKWFRTKKESALELPPHLTDGFLDTRS